MRCFCLHNLDSRAATRTHGKFLMKTVNFEQFLKSIQFNFYVSILLPCQEPLDYIFIVIVVRLKLNSEQTCFSRRQLCAHRFVTKSIQQWQSKQSSQFTIKQMKYMQHVYTLKIRKYITNFIQQYFIIYYSTPYTIQNIHKYYVICCLDAFQQTKFRKIKIVYCNL